MPYRDTVIRILAERLPHFFEIARHVQYSVGDLEQNAEIFAEFF